jgi:hypothetical protein
MIAHEIGQRARKIFHLRNALLPARGAPSNLSKGPMPKYK